VIAESYIDKDEDAFAKRHLASEGSLFFRRFHQYPRSFLWRILNNRKTLEIQSTDLGQDGNHKFEANITLLLNFPSPIRPFGIALAEPEDRDALVVFAITEAKELYTLSLHRDFFLKPAASEMEVSDWCKSFIPSPFSFRTPYRLVAPSVNQLLVSLDDGSILELTREHKETVVWTETFFKQSNWSLRNLVSWGGQNSVRFGSVDLDASAAAAMAISPDGKHIFSVTLDHRLRAWNITSGRPGVQMDLLGEQPNPNEKVPPYFIGPSQSVLMAVVDAPGGVDGSQYYIVTYSPKQHQFKIWGVRDADDPELGIVDIQSDVAFVPPIDELMNTTVWNLEEFHIHLGITYWRDAQIWIRARSGQSSSIYSLKFNLNDDSTRLTSAWKYSWVGVDSGALTVEALKRNASNPGEGDSDSHDAHNPGVTEKWLDFLFHPGRFTTATLETALLIYQRGLDRKRSTQHLPSNASLKERICATVSAFAAQAESAEPGEFQEKFAIQWDVFYGLIKDLHKRRGECLSLVFDEELNMPWLVLSDYLSAIRKNNLLETIALNSDHFSAARDDLPVPLRKELREYGGMARLVHAASLFRRNLPRPFRTQFENEVNRELLQAQSTSVLDRMEYMEQNCDLCNQVSDEDLSTLIEELGTSVINLRTEVFMQIIEQFDPEASGRTMQTKQITRYGLASLMRTSQDTLEVDCNVLLDLMVLILFLQFALEEDEVSEDLDAPELFVEIINLLKDKSVTTWLTGTAWGHPASTGPASEQMMASLNETLKPSRRLPIAQTVMEGIFGHRCFDMVVPAGKGTQLLTDWSRMWLAEVFKDQNYNSAVDVVFGVLLAQKEYDLAVAFSKFLEERNWTEYLKGRMYLCVGEYTLASISFQKAAYNLAMGMFSIDDADTINFIPPDQRDYFSDGLPRYYAHVLGLFEKAKAHSFVVDFGKLALRSMDGSEEADLKTELLSRLFNASVQTSRFDEAYSALIRHKDTALQTSALQTLITTMAQQSQAGRLLRFPFGTLCGAVDDILNTLCHRTLNMASGPPYHQILYAFRISRNDFRGAALILYDRLQRLKSSSAKAHDPADESMVQCYMLIINALSSVSEEEAYILADQRLDESSWGIGKGKKMLKRQIVTLETLRREYAAELDRVAAIENGQYPFMDGADEMDIL
jgi:DNA repair protein RAD51/nuclear pore complex protein Nup160